MYDWSHYFCGEWEGGALVNWLNHTSLVTAVTPTDRPKSVRNSCVIKLFGGVFMLSRCFLDCSVGVGVFVTGLSQISSFFSWNAHSICLTHTTPSLSIYANSYQIKLNLLCEIWNMRRHSLSFWIFRLRNFVHISSKTIHMKSSMTFIQSIGCTGIDLIFNKYGGGLYNDRSALVEVSLYLSRSAIVVKSKFSATFLCCHVAFWILLWV